MVNSLIPDPRSLPNLKMILQTHGKRRGLNLTEQSLRLGFSKRWLTQALKNRDQKISVLIGLSILHQVNYLEIYFPHLPETIRPTDRERQLQKQIDELKKELAQTAKERDKYFDALAGKM